MHFKSWTFSSFCILLAAILVHQCFGEILGTTVKDINTSDVTQIPSVYSYSECVKLITEDRPLRHLIAMYLTTSYKGVNRTLEVGSHFSKYLPTLGGIVMNTVVPMGNLTALKDLISTGALLDVCDKDGLTPLYKAMESDFEQGTQVLIKCGANVNFKYGGNSLLHTAARNGSKDLVEKLVNVGAEIDNENSKGYTPLYLSIRRKCSDTTRFLINKGSDVNFRTKSGRSLLHIAVLENDIESIDQITQIGGLVNSEDSDQHTPLFDAVRLNYTDIVDFLLERGANVDFISSRGNPLLHLAVTEGLLHAVIKLIDLGANAASEDSDGLTALHHAIEKDDVQMSMAFLKFYDKLEKPLPQSGDTTLHFAVRKGAILSLILLMEFENSSGLNKKGLTPFALAVYLNQTRAIKLFLEKKPQKDISLLYNINDGNNSYSPLHVAVVDKNLVAVENMIKYGAYVNRKDKVGKTPLWMAVEVNDSAMVELLVSKQAIVTTKVHPSSDTMLHLAVYNQCLQCARILIDSGIDVNSQGDSCLTPLLIAAMLNNRNLVKLLISKGANVNYEPKCGAEPFIEASSKYGLGSLMSVYEYLPKSEKANLTEKAAESSQPEVLQYLIGNRRAFNANRRDRLMQIAVKRGNIDAMKLLLQLGLGMYHYTPESLLTLALNNRQPAAMETLILYGADMDMKVKVPFATPAGIIKKSWSLLHQAAYMNGKNEAEVLLNNGMDVNIKDDLQWTPIHVAAMIDHSEVGHLLIRRGADLSVLTIHGYTPLYIAQSTNSTRMVALLNFQKTSSQFSSPNPHNHSAILSMAG